MPFRKKEKINENLHKGTTIIKDDLLSRDECETIIKGKYIDGVGCVVDETELPDGSKVFREPPLKVIKRRKTIDEEKEEMVEEEKTEKHSENL